MILQFLDPNKTGLHAKNLFEILVDNVRLHPDKIYYYGNSETVTYQQMYDASKQLAQQIYQHLNVTHVPTVAVSTQNSEIILRLTWACLGAGICLAFLPVSHDSAQIESLMSQIETTCLVTDIPELQAKLGGISFQSLQQNKLDAAVTLVAPQLETPAFIFQTSGTTGTPKWVQITHGQFLEAIIALTEMNGLDHGIDQVTYITQPLSHSYGLSALLEYSAVGAAIVLPSSHKGLGPITSLISSPMIDVITAIEGVTYFYTQMSRLLNRIHLPHLQHIGLGGGKLNLAVINDIREFYPNLTFSIRYGLTETPSVVSHKVFTPPYLDDWDTSGKILPIYDLQIVDQAGNRVRDGQEGEIQIKGSSLAWPYYGETAVTQYFATGDIGYIHSETKELYIVGRKSLFLKVQGYRISPEFIEAIINRAEGVLESRVSGTDDAVFAEIVRATQSVMQQPLLAYLATKLPSYAIPKTITFVEAIPKTASGKIKRH